MIRDFDVEEAVAKKIDDKRGRLEDSAR